GYGLAPDNPWLPPAYSWSAWEFRSPESLPFPGTFWSAWPLWNASSDSAGYPAGADPGNDISDAALLSSCSLPRWGMAASRIRKESAGNPLGSRYLLFSDSHLPRRNGVPRFPSPQ